MGEIFKFIKNAVKAILLSPYYLLVFVLFIICTIFNYLIGEIRSFFGIFTANGFSHLDDNEYNQILVECKKQGVSYDVLKTNSQKEEVKKI